MPKQELPVNFKDDILASSMAGKRKYLITQNEDASYSLEDVTDYTQSGSNLGAKQINEICQAINDSADKSRIIDNLDDIVANKTPGMIAGAQAVAALNAYLLQLQAHHDKKTLTPTDLGIRVGVWTAIANNSYKIGKTIHLNMEIYTTATIVANNVYDKKNGGLENKREKDGIQISIMLLHGNLFQNHTRRKRNAEKGQNKRSTAPEAGREHPATRN